MDVTHYVTSFINCMLFEMCSYIVVIYRSKWTQSRTRKLDKRHTDTSGSLNESLPTNKLIKKTKLGYCSQHKSQNNPKQMKKKPIGPGTEERWAEKYGSFSKLGWGGKWDGRYNNKNTRNKFVNFITHTQAHLRMQYAEYWAL